MVDDDSSSGSFSGDSEATLVGEMTVEEFSARMKILAPPLNSKDAELQQELLAKQKEFEVSYKVVPNTRSHIASRLGWQPLPRPCPFHLSHHARER